MGESDSKKAGSGPSQGSVDAALISSNSMGNSLKELFDEEDKEITYNNDLVLSALAYMDDVGRVSMDREKTQYGIDRMEELLNRKGLEFNQSKSNFLIIGSKKEQRRLQKEIEETPLKLCKENMKQVKNLKILGDFISSELSESVHQTILKRIGVATISIYEIRAVVEDRRARCIGGINVGLNIFISSITPMIFFNS